MGRSVGYLATCDDALVVYVSTVVSAGTPVCVWACVCVCVRACILEGTNFCYFSD